MVRRSDVPVLGATRRPVKVIQYHFRSILLKNKFEHVVVKEDLQRSKGACQCLALKRYEWEGAPIPSPPVPASYNNQRYEQHLVEHFRAGIGECCVGPGRLLCRRASFRRNSPTETGLRYTGGFRPRNRRTQNFVLGGYGSDGWGPVGGSWFFLPCASPWYVRPRDSSDWHPLVG